MSQPKKLTLNDLNKLDKQLDELRTIYLADGKYTCQVYTKFRTTKIQKMLLDLQECFELLKQENVNLEDVKNMFLIFNMLLIKHFTDLPLEKIDVSTREGISKLIRVADQLTDTGLFAEIINSFDSNEIQKINSLLRESNMMGEQLGEMMARIALNYRREDEDSANVQQSE